MIFKKFCILALRPKIASALEGLREIPFVLLRAILSILQSSTLSWICICLNHIDNIIRLLVAAASINGLKAFIPGVHNSSNTYDYILLFSPFMRGGLFDQCHLELSNF